jgi:hypothetical protein
MPQQKNGQTMYYVKLRLVALDETSCMSGIIFLTSFAVGIWLNN